MTHFWECVQNHQPGYLVYLVAHPRNRKWVITSVFSVNLALVSQVKSSGIFHLLTKWDEPPSSIEKICCVEWEFYKRIGSAHVKPVFCGCNPQYHVVDMRVKLRDS